VDQTPERPLDEYLVLLSQAGSTDALDGLARRWTPRLLRYAARVLGGSTESAETARDVVQETWVGAIRGLRGLRDPAQFPAWIYGIATRKCADAIRTNMRRRRLDAHSVAGDASLREATVSVEHQIDVATGIRELPPKQRAAVHLFYGEDLTVEEIASALGIPTGTVKSRLHHAREALKRHLGVGRALAPGPQEGESRPRRTS
jgi:RNA polymerase sigma-70 factor (ECF subfamily)